MVSPFAACTSVRGWPPLIGNRIMFDLDEMPRQAACMIIAEAGQALDIDDLHDLPISKDFLIGAIWMAMCLIESCPEYITKPESLQGFKSIYRTLRKHHPKAFKKITDKFGIDIVI